MAWIPNRIDLIFHGRYDEAVAASQCYPGMMLQYNGSGQLQPNQVAGSGGLIMVAREDVLRGADATQPLPANDQIPILRPTKGDMLLMLLQNGQNVAQNIGLESAGDGTLIAATNGKLYEIVAPSTVITNTATETAFSNGTFTFPANYLQVGDVIHVRSKVFCVAENSTNTHRIRLYLGATPLTIADSTALQLAANDVVIFDLYITVRTITSSGTIIVTGVLQYTVSGTWTTTAINDVSATLDSTVADALVIKSLASAASTGNQIRLDEFQVNVDRATGFSSPFTSFEAINNSSGTGTSGFNSAAFIRVLVA